MRRKTPPGILFDDLPPIDLILISHGHWDHFDLNTLRRFPRDIPIIVPRKLGRYLEIIGFKRVKELKVWEREEIKEVKITAVSAQHYSGINPLFSPSDYQGYLIQGSRTLYFAGDTSLFEGLRDIGERYKIDLALLPIGAYKPDSFRRRHMSPEDALTAMKLLKAKMMVPIHWGAFRFSLEPLDEPPSRLEVAARAWGLSSKVRILKPGERIGF